MKTFTTLLVICWIALACGSPVTQDEPESVTKKGSEEAVKKIIDNNNKLEEEVKSNVTDYEDRLAARAESAGLGEYPYQVSIQINGQHHCGGALISESHILTAGHCVHDYVKNPYSNPNAITVEVGTVTIGGGSSYRVKRLACMKGFTTDQNSAYFLPDDVAVITLQQRVAATAYVKIIRLPSAYSEPPVGARVVVTGFGNSVYGAPTSPIMRKTELNIVTTQECDSYYSSTLRLRVTSNHICAKRGSGYGTCQGDSGGPMMYNRQVVGLVSGGNGRCGEGAPDIFTKVSRYLSFINYELGNPTGSGGPSNAIEVNSRVASYPTYPQNGVQQVSNLNGVKFRI